MHVQGGAWACTLSGLAGTGQPNHALIAQRQAAAVRYAPQAAHPAATPLLRNPGAHTCCCRVHHQGVPLGLLPVPCLLPRALAPSAFLPSSARGPCSLPPGRYSRRTHTAWCSATPGRRPRTRRRRTATPTASTRTRRCPCPCPASPRSAAPLRLIIINLLWQLSNSNAPPALPGCPCTSLARPLLGGGGGQPLPGEATPEAPCPDRCDHHTPRAPCPAGSLSCI